MKSNMSDVQKLLSYSLIKKLVIPKIEVFDINAARWLLESQNILTTYERKVIKKMIGGAYFTNIGGVQYNAHTVYYSLGKSNWSMPDSYDYESIGRFFPRLGVGMQGLRGEIRSILSRKLYWDIDMVNAHPVLLLQVCQKNGWKCDTLDYYVSNREKVLSSFALEHELFTNRWECKVEIIRMMYGGKPNEFSPQWVCQEFYPEIEQIMTNICKLPECKDFLRVAKSKQNKLGNVLGCCTALYLQTLEMQTLTLLDDYLSKQCGRHMGVWIHDGGYILKKEGELEFPKEILRAAEEYISTRGKFGNFKVSLIQKEIPKGNVEVPLRGEINPDNVYAMVKAKHELNHFFLRDVGLYYEIKEDGKILIRSEDELITCYKAVRFSIINKKGDVDDTKQFIYEWVKDPTKRLYENVCFCPPPLVVPKNYYNLWTGFDVEKFDIDNGDTLWSSLDDEGNGCKNDFGLQLFLDHLNLLCGEECRDYVINWLSLLFQKPGKKPNTMLLFRTQDGLGKQIFYDILTKMIGKDLCYKTHNIDRDIFGNFNQKINNKILIILDEMNDKLSKPKADLIKSFVTSTEETINMKYKNPFESNNTSHVMGYSNNEFPMEVGEKDRRLAAIDRKMVKIPDEKYFELLGKHVLDDNNVLRRVYNFFMNQDISNFNAQYGRPQTKFLEQLKEISRSNQLSFFIEFLIGKLDEKGNVKYKNKSPNYEILADDFFQEYMAYREKCQCGDNVGKNPKIALGMSLNSTHILGFTKSKSYPAKYTFDMELARDWLISNKYFCFEE